MTNFLPESIFLFLRKFFFFSGEIFWHFIRKWQPFSTEFIFLLLGDFIFFLGIFFWHFIHNSSHFSTEKHIQLYGNFFTVIQSNLNYFFIFHYFWVRKNFYRNSSILRGHNLSAFFKLTINNNQDSFAWSRWHAIWCYA